MHGRDQVSGPLGEGDLLTHFIEDGLRQTGQQSDTFGQGFGEVELAGHGAFGDVGDLVSDSGVGGDEVDDLLVDERRIDVHDEQLDGDLGGMGLGRLIHPFIVATAMM